MDSEGKKSKSIHKIFPYVRIFAIGSSHNSKLIHPIWNILTCFLFIYFLFGTVFLMQKIVQITKESFISRIYYL